MDFLNGITDVILTVVCLFVFFKYLKPLDLSTTLLWESFVLSIGASAFFGALNFFGIYQAEDISAFFQNVATIAGSIGLIAASFSIVIDKPLSDTRAYGIIGIGMVLFFLYEFLNIVSLKHWLPIVSMILVALSGFLAFAKGAPLLGTWLIVGVLFFALGSFRNEIFGRSHYSISLFHLLISAGVLSIGMANLNYRIKRLQQ